MSAKRYICTWEAAFKLNSGLRHEQFIVTSQSYDENVRRMTTAVLKYAKANEALFLGSAMSDSQVIWRPAIPAMDVLN